VLFRSYYQTLGAREGDSTTIDTIDTRIFYSAFNNALGGLENAYDAVTTVIPITSNGNFDLIYDRGGATPSGFLYMSLIGWGE